MSAKHKRKLSKSLSCDSSALGAVSAHPDDRTAKSDGDENGGEEKAFVKREEFICSTAHNAHLQEDFLEDKSQLFGRQLPHVSSSRNIRSSASKPGLKHVSSERLLRKFFKAEQVSDTQSLRSVSGGKSLLTPVQEEKAAKKRRRRIPSAEDGGETPESDGSKAQLPQKPPRRWRISRKGKHEQSKASPPTTAPDSPASVKTVVVQNGNCVQENSENCFGASRHDTAAGAGPETPAATPSDAEGHSTLEGPLRPRLIKRNSMIRPLRSVAPKETPKLYQRHSLTHQRSFSGADEGTEEETPERPQRHKLLKRESLIHPVQAPRRDVPLGAGSLFQPQFNNGRFQNPLAWFRGNGTGTWNRPSIWSALRWKLFEKNNSSVPSSSKELDDNLPVVPLRTEAIRSPPNKGIRVTWLGHSSLLVQFDGMSILTDPMFSDRASPFAGLGAKRIQKMPGSVHDLPKIDAVLVSHNHYDHLDTDTVVLLNARFGADLQWFVPLGLAQWLRATNCANVTELTWWQEGSLQQNVATSFVLTPAQHWSRRGLTDENKTLWGSWCVLGPRHSFFFTGDSGYCGDAFRQIGAQYGPFDLAAIPIGAYEPRWFLHPQHVNPEEAVKIHLDVKAKRSVGIHWGTFILSGEHYLEPPKKLREAAQQHQLAADEFFVLGHGESKMVGAS